MPLVGGSLLCGGPGAMAHVWRVLELGWALQAAVSWNSRRNWRIFHVGWALTMVVGKMRKRH